MKTKSPTAEKLSKIAKATPAAAPSPSADSSGPQQPVAGYPFTFEWSLAWAELFDHQIELIREDIHRARSEDKQVIYLSCPISSRGGGYASTNVEIARSTQNRILARWGTRVWVLNPAMYQMESKGGAGLMNRHAKQHNLRLPETPPSGGDYMRMWTKVLIEETLPKLVSKTPHPGPHCGGHFDAYYFLGPRDVHRFFTQGQDVPLTDAIEKYFAQKLAVDADFRDQYTDRPVIDWGEPPKEQGEKDLTARDEWETKRKQFFRYYALRAGVNYSLGSHDEWNILVEVNRRRAARLERGLPGIGELMAAWFDGCQVPPGAAEILTAKGYDLQGTSPTTVSSQNKFSTKKA